jgi:hypothetical protein
MESWPESGTIAGPTRRGPRHGIAGSRESLNLYRTLRVMAMTLRLSVDEDATLTRLARTFKTSKNSAAAVAIDLALPKADHPEFVRESTERLLQRYAGLMGRLAEA